MNVDSVKGHLVNMVTSDPRHYGSSGVMKTEKGDGGESFMGMLKKAIGGVNDLQVESEDLMQKMVYKPESVDVHTVMIASQKAEIALTLTKTIRDEAIRAFRELMNLR